MNPVRAAAKKRLYDLLRGRLTGVQVEYNEPVGFEQSCVWLGKVTGESAVRHLKAGAKNRSDDFTVEVFALALTTGEADGYDADVAVAALWAEVDGLLRVSPFLSIDGSGLSGVTGARLGVTEGPNCGWFQIGDNVQAFGSQIRGDVLIQSVLT